eukprot:gene6949-19418_t
MRWLQLVYGTRQCSLSRGAGNLAIEGGKYAAPQPEFERLVADAGELEECFMKYGESGAARGFAIVTYKYREAAERALRAYAMVDPTAGEAEWVGGDEEEE